MLLINNDFYEYCLINTLFIHKDYLIINNIYYIYLSFTSNVKKVIYQKLNGSNSFMFKNIDDGSIFSLSADNYNFIYGVCDTLYEYKFNYLKYNL